MTRRRIALLLTALIAASGVIPLLLLAIFGLRILGDRGERASQEALEAIAAQAAARIATYIAQQREMLRAIGTAVADESDAVRRLADIALDAPSLGKLRLLSADTPQREVPRMLDRDRIAAALRGTEVASETYIAELSPAMDVCFRESAENSESMSEEWQSATISKFEDSGRLRVMGEEELAMSMSSFGGREKRTSTLPLRLSTFTLPPAFSMEMS